MSAEDDRRARAEARSQRTWLRRTRLGAAEVELDPISGPAAVALAARLSEECWTLSGRPPPSYTRANIPCRFVAGRVK